MDLWLIFVVGMLVSVAVCWKANLLNRAEGLPAEAPTGIMVVLLVVAIGGAVLQADTVIQDPCSLIDPDESWAAYLLWLANGCWLP